MLHLLSKCSKLNHFKDNQCWQKAATSWTCSSGLLLVQLGGLMLVRLTRNLTMRYDINQCHRWDSINSLTATIVGPKHPEMYMFFLIAICRFCLSYVWKQCGKISITVTAVARNTYIFGAGSQALQEGTGQPERPQETIASRSLRSSARANWTLSIMFDYKNPVLLDQRLATLVVSVLAPSHITSVGVVRVLYEALDLRECILVEEVDVHHHAVFSTFLGILLQCEYEWKDSWTFYIQMTIG